MCVMLRVPLSETDSQHFNYTVPHITLHKTSCLFWVKGGGGNEIIPTTTAQQTQRVDEGRHKHTFSRLED
jgi:hypothetical protein